MSIWMTSTPHPGVKICKNRLRVTLIGSEEHVKALMWLNLLVHLCWRCCVVNTCLQCTGRPRLLTLNSHDWILDMLIRACTSYHSTNCFNPAPPPAQISLHHAYHLTLWRPLLFKYATFRINHLSHLSERSITLHADSNYLLHRWLHVFC